MHAYIRTNIDSIFVDGNDHEVSYSVIVAEFDDGARFILNDSECNHYYYDKSRGLVRIDNETVYARMQKLVDKINEKGTIDYQYWTGTDPRYGSERYLNPGITM